MDQWANKVAIVTAANTEVGAEICRRLCCHQVIVVGLTPQLDQLNALGEEIREVQENAQFHAVQCDLEKEEEVQSVLDYVGAELGGVDVLVNVATTSPEEYGLLLEEEEDEEEDDEKSESMQAPVNILSKKVHQSILERGTGSRGHIIGVFYVAEDCKEEDKDRCSAAIWPVGKELCHFSQPRIKVSKLCAMNVRTNQLEEEDEEIEKEVDTEKKLFIGPKDIADTVSYCLSTPVHVQIKDIQLGATGGEF